MTTSAPIAGVASYPSSGCNPFPGAIGHSPLSQTIGLVQQFVESTSQLFSLPAAAAEVLRLTGEPTIDLNAIKHCVESDPALTARILRVTNSSLFGSSRQVTDLNQALTLLGIRPLKILVLGFSLPKGLFAGLEAEVLSWYWRHTLVKAVAARELAERLWRLPGDEPFLAGLVQDIGVLALIQQLGQPYQQLLTQVRTHGGSLLASELETLGFDHLVLSSRLLSHWGLPAALCAAVSVPPQTDRVQALCAAERPIPQMLHLAELLARLVEQPYGSALHDLLAAGSKYCGLTHNNLQPLLASLESKVQDLAAVLSLELPEGQSYVELLLAAHARMAEETLFAAASPPEPALGELATQLKRELAAAANRSAAGNIKQQRLPPASATTTSQSKLESQRVGAAAPSKAPAVEGISRVRQLTDWQSRLVSLIATGRQKRLPVALALFEVDRFGDVLMQLGAGGTMEAMHLLRDAIAEWAGSSSQSILVSDSRVALLCCGSTRREAVELARQALTVIKPWSRQQFPLSFELTLSCGLAALEVPSHNFPSGDMLAAAERCLTAAQLSGGGAVKSLDL